MTITLETLSAAMRLSDFDVASTQDSMAPKPRARLQQFAGIPAKEAGVLALLYPERDGLLHIVLTRRQDHLRGHAGQISLPGGKRDPGDESFVATALRETREELGIDTQSVQIIGQLARFYIPPSNFNVHPSVGYLPQAAPFKPNPAEVAEVITFPIRELLQPHNKHAEIHDFQGMKVNVPFYTINAHKIWGATAAMLGELETRIRVVLHGA